MPRLKSHRRKNDPFNDSEEDVQELPLEDEELREEELVNLLGIDAPVNRRESATDDFSWEVYLEHAWR